MRNESLSESLHEKSSLVPAQLTPTSSSQPPISRNEHHTQIQLVPRAGPRNDTTYEFPIPNWTQRAYINFQVEAIPEMIPKRIYINMLPDVRKQWVWPQKHGPPSFMKLQSHNRQHQTHTHTQANWRHKVALQTQPKQQWSEHKQTNETTTVHKYMHTYVHTD